MCNEYDDRGVFEFTGDIKYVHFDFGDFTEPSGMDRLEMATKLD